MKIEYIIILILFIIGVITYCFLYFSKDLQRKYKKEIKNAFSKNGKEENSILTETDITHLPKPVQDFLIYVGVIGKEKVHQFTVVAEGEIRLNQNSNWAKIKISQNNFIGKKLIRLFYLKMKIYGIPIYALHSYTDKEASMIGKLAGILPIINAKGAEMRIGDTTTLFNDMCLFAPATLIDKRISWELVDELTVNATLSTEYATVTATLYFNKNHQLINFTSEDRYYDEDYGIYHKTKWTTPFGQYKEINGLRLPSYGEAIWNLPNGDYCYCKFTNIKSIRYNTFNTLP